VYPACTWLSLFDLFARFWLFGESATYASSTSLLVRSPPPLPVISLNQLSFNFLFVVICGQLWPTKVENRGQSLNCLSVRISYDVAVNRQRDPRV